jgi:hypothetical protein
MVESFVSLGRMSFSNILFEPLPYLFCMIKVVVSELSETRLFKINTKSWLPLKPSGPVQTCERNLGLLWRRSDALDYVGSEALKSAPHHHLRNRSDMIHFVG